MSTSNYITLPIETDAPTLATQAIQFLMTLQPGWVPNEANLEVAILEVTAWLNAETRDLAALVPAEIFRFAGKSLFQIPSIDGAPATAQSTWTMRDGAGYTIKAGTLVGYQTSGNTLSYFSVQSNVTVSPGSVTTGTGEVTLVASAYGSSYNGLVAQDIVLVDALAFVADVTTTTTTAGGVDRETDDAYLDRLRSVLQLLSPRPIRPNDFAVMARSIAGVDRSVAIDGYNPFDGTYNNERMVAVALADSQGQAVTPDIAAAVQAYLEAQREVNFVVNTIDPTYTELDVTATVKALPGVDKGAVQAAATQAVTDYLDPSNWSWSPVVRLYELIALLSNVSGVDYVEMPIVEPSGDVVLEGVAALVKAGSVQISSI